MKKLVALSFSLITISAFAQKHNSEDAIAPVNQYQGTEMSIPMNKVLYENEDLGLWLKQELELNSDIDLELVNSIESLTAHHHHYQIKINNIPVFDGIIHAVVSKEGTVQKVMKNLVPLTINQESSSFPASELETLKDEMNAAVATEKKVWFPLNGQLIAANMGHFENGTDLHSDIVYANGEILQSINNSVYLHNHGPNDTLINGYIFDPDPLSTAMVNYNAPYRDYNDSSYALLENEKVLKKVLASYSNGVFELKNDFVRLVNITAPNIAPMVQTNPDFLFTRDQAAFEDVNVLYHLTEHKLHMDALGFTNLPGYIIQVDAHALGGSDNSRFTPSTPGVLEFGEGGVDDAEDADVIIHEYTHAYAFAASLATSGTQERGTLNESVADYFAASYSRTINNYNQDQVYNWDGHNEYWIGRMVSSTKDYKQVNFTTYYDHTDLFASALLEAYDIIGRNAMDQVVMEGIFSMGTNTTFRQMAGHILDADLSLNNGANYQILKTAFVRRNILDITFDLDDALAVENDLRVYGTFEFSLGGELIVESNLKSISGYTIYDMTAKPVLKGLDGAHASQLQIGSSELNRGFYVLEIVLEDGFRQSFKISKS